VKIHVFKPEIKLEKVGNVTIEAANSFSENTDLKATVLYPTSLGLSLAGSIYTEFNKDIEFKEKAGTSYYNGTNGATSLPKKVTASSGVANITLKSISNSTTITGPTNADIDATAANTTQQAATNPIAVDQWVDGNSDGWVDWLRAQADPILTCYQGKAGEPGAVASSVTSMTQLNSACGTTPLGTTNIRISTVCTVGGVNRHRTNVSNELSDTIIHEARHSWVNQELKRNDVGVDDDGSALTPSNDDDQDRWPEVLGGFSSANSLLESSSPSGSDNSVDPNPSNTVQETDAANYAGTVRSLCP